MAVVRRSSRGLDPFDETLGSIEENETTSGWGEGRGTDPQSCCLVLQIRPSFYYIVQCVYIAKVLFYLCLITRLWPCFSANGTVNWLP